MFFFFFFFGGGGGGGLDSKYVITVLYLCEIGPANLCSTSARMIDQ